MITDQEFVSLLNRIEDETLDFKVEEYDLSQDRSKFAFVKDVICLANTPSMQTELRQPAWSTALIGKWTGY